MTILALRIACHLIQRAFAIDVFNRDEDLEWMKGTRDCVATANKLTIKR